jgi:hypothetical protein
VRIWALKYYLFRKAKGYPCQAIMWQLTVFRAHDTVYAHGSRALKHNDLAMAIKHTPLVCNAPAAAASHDPQSGRGNLSL